jgi:hypothetical protein
VELEAGLIGLLVGAVVSGGVQATLARLDRGRDARGAARLLYMELSGAQGAIEDLQGRVDWDLMITDWDAYGTAWAKYAESLAGVLDTESFHSVSLAFASMARLAQAHAADAKRPPPPPGGQPNFSPPAAILEKYRDNVKAAKSIAFQASFTWWEKMRHKDSKPAERPTSRAAIEDVVPHD